METETTTWSEFPNGGKAIAKQLLAWEERDKSKRAGLCKSQSGIRAGKLTIWVRSFEKNHNKVHQIYQIYHNRFASPSDMDI